MKKIKKKSNISERVIKKELNEIKRAVKKAKKEILEAEDAIDNAQEEVVDAADIFSEKQRRKLISAARYLEKAVHTAGESCESTEEAEIKVKDIKG